MFLYVTIHSLPCMLPYSSNNIMRWILSQHLQSTVRIKMFAFVLFYLCSTLLYKSLLKAVFLVHRLVDFTLFGNNSKFLCLCLYFSIIQQCFIIGILKPARLVKVQMELWCSETLCVCMQCMQTQPNSTTVAFYFSVNVFYRCGR